MLARDKHNRRRAKFNAPGLVCPVVIHDAKDLPKQLGIIQKLEIQDFFTVRLAEGSKLAEELEVAIKGKSSFIAKAISGAPHWKLKWATDAAQQFYKRYFQRVRVEQRRTPRFSD